jgi:hypothetical protein
MSFANSAIGVAYRQVSAVGDEGLEPTAKSPGNRGVGVQSGAECGAPDSPKTPFDPELASVVDAWPKLPDAIKAGIVAMIRAAGI